MIRKRKYLIICFLVASTLWVSLFTAPRAFPRDEIIEIAKGSGVAEIANQLAIERVIRWPMIFRLVLALRSGPSVIVAGDYAFSQPRNVWRVAGQLSRGDYGLVPAKVTFPEGSHAREMAEILSGALNNFDKEKFLILATPREGYLFPDTYFFRTSISEEEIVNSLLENFEKKIKPLAGEITASGRTREQIIIMASILEEEARTPESRRMISGILWKRLDIGMPLQVDAVFPYISDKNTFNLSRSDLATSSPYNTYRFRGLPIGPITNPGLDAIMATIQPTESKYLFYLSDYDSEMHYAVDFDEHKLNKAKYLP